MNLKPSSDDSHIKFAGQKTEEKLKDDIFQNSTQKNLMTKGLEKTLFVENKIQKYNLDDLGTIERAKIHRKANRPLHIKQEFNKNVNFCHCCDLPCEEKGIIEPFKICDDPDYFAEYGLGISLYFYFFKFVIFIAFLGILSLSIIIIIHNIIYSGDIKDICNEQFKSINNETKLGNCYGYVSESSKDDSYYNKFNQWLQRLSSDHIFIYRALHANYIGLNNKNIDNDEDIDDVIVNYSLMNFIFLITTFILNIIFLFLIRAYIKWLNKNNFTIRDYTVLISNANPILISYTARTSPLKIFLKGQSQIAVENYDDFILYVNNYLKNEKDLQDIKLEHINLCHNLGDYLKIMKDYEKCKYKMFQINNSPYNIKENINKKYEGEQRKYFNFSLSPVFYCCSSERESLSELKEIKIKKEQELRVAEAKVSGGSFNINDFTGYMLISFNHIEDKEKFLSYYPEDFFGKLGYFFRHIHYYICSCCLDQSDKDSFNRSRDINARNPPEPEDIIWENFACSSWERTNKIIKTYAICLFIIIVSFGILLGLSFLQDKLYNDDKENGDTNIFLKYLTSLCITIVVSILNAIIQFVLEKITYREKHISKSNYILSLSIKITIFTFVNSAIVPLISKYIVAKINEDNNEKIVDYVRRKRDDLLIDDMFMYFLVNAIITPIMWILNFPYWYKKLRICIIERKKDRNLHHHMTQKELNELYELPDFNLAYKLSYLAKTLAMCFFFMPIFPAGFILVFIGFIFAYWVDKFVFTHQCKRPEMLDEIIEQFYANFFIVILFIGGVGDYIFLHDAYHTDSWTLINIIVFGVLIIVPYARFLTCDCLGNVNNSKYGNRPLSDVYFTFYNDYQRQNPLTKKEGLKNYLIELKKHDYLSENAFNLAFKNIDNLNLMEIYYGMLKDNMPLVHQSVIGEVPTISTLSSGNFRRSILGQPALKSTIIRPEIKDNLEQKKLKREFYDSQIMNILGKTIANVSLPGHMSNIDEVEKERETETSNKQESKINITTNDKLNLNALPVTKSVYQENTDNNNIQISNVMEGEN